MCATSKVETINGNQMKLFLLDAERQNSLLCHNQTGHMKILLNQAG